MSKIKYLAGFDTECDTFDMEGRILRGINYDFSQVRSIFEDFNDYLAKKNVVKTRIVNPKDARLTNYSLVLEHEKISPINYPHEWSSQMYMDAAIFHLELFINLLNRNLILKDWSPLNILFKNSNPVFVDYTSIIPKDRLIKEEYLETKKYYYDLFFSSRFNRYVFEMYQRMYIPYFLLPLYLLKLMGPVDARQRIYETVLNGSFEVINEKEVFTVSPLLYLKFKKDFLNAFFSLMVAKDVKGFFQMLVKEIKSIKINKNNFYSGYYANKNGNLSFTNRSKWTDKQITIWRILQNKHDTLLDIGSNTGWFSILAAKLGWKVIALDIDDTCVNNLYENSKKNNLIITPLVLDITKLRGNLYPVKYENQKKVKKFQKDNSPLLLSEEKRFKSNTILGLALIHHLCLGKGMKMQEVIDLFDSFSEKHMVLEFVDKEDKLIKQEPSFFPSYFKRPISFEWYNLNNFIKILKKKYKKIELFDSDSITRKIIFATK